mgnify:CR=1 FL=1
MTEPEIFEILRKIRYDLTAAQTKVTEALNTLSLMNLPGPPPEFVCAKCGGSYPAEMALALHMQNVHDGPAVPMTPEEDRA